MSGETRPVRRVRSRGALPDTWPETKDATASLVLGQSRRKWYGRHSRPGAQQDPELVSPQRSGRACVDSEASSPSRPRVSLYRTSPTATAASPSRRAQSAATASSESSTAQKTGLGESVTPPLTDPSAGASAGSAETRRVLEAKAAPTAPTKVSRPKSSGPPPPPPLLKRSAAGRAQSAEAKPPSQTPFGRRLHWIDPSYARQDESSLFGRGAADIEIDPSLLSEVLAGGKGLSPSASRQRCTSKCREEKTVRVLSASRAQNAAILLRKLPISVSQICERARIADFSPVGGLRAEDLELLLKKLPTPEEAQSMLRHADAPEELRDVERDLLPLCRLPCAERRLKLFHAALVHGELHVRLLDNFRCLQAAAEEVLSSKRLHNLLRTVLQTANYINHGSASEGATALPVRSLAVFASFKVGSGASVLHYLCLTLCDADFLAGLRSDLVHLPGAARQSAEVQQQEIRDFKGLVKLAEVALEEELSANACSMGTGAGVTGERSTDSSECGGIGAADAAAGGSAVPSGPLQDLFASLRQKLAELEVASQQTQVLVEKAQRFLGEQPQKMVASEEFFSHILNFLDLLTATSAETARNRASSMSRSRIRSVSSSSPLQA